MPDDKRAEKDEQKSGGLFVQEDSDKYSDLFDADFSDEDEDLEPTMEFDEYIKQNDTLKTEKKSSDTRVLDLRNVIEESRNRRMLRFAVVTGGILLILLLIYIFGVVYYRNVFFPETYINGVNVSGKNADQALTALQSSTDERSVVLEGKLGKTAVVRASQIELAFNDAPDVEKLLEKQNTFLWPFALLIPNQTELNSEYTVNRNAFNTLINSLPMVSEGNTVAPEDAKIVFDGTNFTITPAIEGDQIDINKLKKAIEKALINNDEVLNLSDAGVYNEPKVLETNTELKSKLTKLNETLNASITINFPTQQVLIDKTVYGPWLYVDDSGNPAVDELSLKNYVGALAQQYNTVGRPVRFLATNGNVYTFSNTRGYELNQNQEIDQLREQILTGKVVTENPIWLQTGNGDIQGDVLTGTYVEVSLTDQMIWFYENNTQILSSPMVSGNFSTNQTSPTGLFYIQDKDMGAVLNVRLPNGTSQNETVSFWMPFYANTGIISASWRSSFGGSIFLYQGTNGNIDVPQDFAQRLYNNVQTGDPVVVY